MQHQPQFNHATKPTVSDKVMLVAQMAAKPSEEDKRKAERKELNMRMLFVDSVSNKCVADVTMNQAATEDFLKSMQRALANAQEKLKGDSMPEKPNIVEPEDTQRYVG